MFTPLFNAGRYKKGLWLKMEYFNPCLSMKYRSIPQRISALHAENHLKNIKKLGIVTAGSAGVCLAWIAQQLKLNAHIIVPSKSDPQIINHARHLGAEVFELTFDQIKDAVRSLEMDDNVFLLDQMKDHSLPDYFQIVGDEIHQQLPEVDSIVVGAGTAASVMGIAKHVVPKGVNVYAVEPAEAQVLAGRDWRPHHLHGLAPPLKTKLFNRDLVTDLLAVQSEYAWQTAHLINKRLSINVGPTSGATIYAASQLIDSKKAEHVVAICASPMTYGKVSSPTNIPKTLLGI